MINKRQRNFSIEQDSPGDSSVVKTIFGGIQNILLDNQHKTLKILAFLNNSIELT